jgi:carbonic anhydrase
MAGIRDEILAANAAYADDFGARGGLALPPARGFAILTCMDARLDPAKFAGLTEGDAHVVRNAGGRATDDAIRSLVISHKLLGTHEWFVVHHTDCGMTAFTDDEMATLLEGSLATAELTAAGFANTADDGGAVEGRFVKWHSFGDHEAALVADVARLRAHPLVNPSIPIHGLVYDVHTGRLHEVEQASAVGRARG